MATHEEIRDLKRRYGQELLGKAGVSGVGIERNASGEYTLVVHLNDPAAQTSLPKTLEGHELQYVVSGPFTKLPVTASR